MHRVLLIGFNLASLCAAVLSAGCGESTVITSTADQPGKGYLGGWEIPRCGFPGGRKRT